MPAMQAEYVAQRMLSAAVDVALMLPGPDDVAALALPALAGAVADRDVERLLANVALVRAGAERADEFIREGITRLAKKVGYDLAPLDEGSVSRLFPTPARVIAAQGVRYDWREAADRLPGGAWVREVFDAAGEVRAYVCVRGGVMVLPELLPRVRELYGTGSGFMGGLSSAYSGEVCTAWNRHVDVLAQDWLYAHSYATGEEITV